jgi:hypothetical protein
MFTNNPYSLIIAAKVLKVHIYIYLVPFLSQNLQATSVTWWDFCPKMTIKDEKEH